MTKSLMSRTLSRLRLPLTGSRTWSRNEDGAAAIEFAMVAIPFLMMLVGIMGSGLQFFSQNALENGVEAASRQVMTGQAQLGNPTASPPVPPMTLDQFRNKICSTAGSFIKCDAAHLSLIVNSYADWASVQQQTCKAGSGLAASTGTGTQLVSQYSGAPGDIVLITICYKWDLAKGVLIYAPDKLGDGSALMQAAVAFRTEPYM